MSKVMRAIEEFLLETVII